MCMDQEYTSIFNHRVDYLYLVVIGYIQSLPDDQKDQFVGHFEDFFAPNQFSSHAFFVCIPFQNFFSSIIISSYQEWKCVLFFRPFIIR